MKRIIITGGNGFIGTNLILAIRERFAIEPIPVYVIDIAPPKVDLMRKESWICLDILNKEELLRVFNTVKPDIVVHLAAETSCDPELTMDDYKVNTEGSKNVYDCCEISKVDFLVNTSTQYVNQVRIPANDTDYAPRTVYGKSKVIAEKFLMEGNYNFNWVIIRPTNIWGRWHIRYPYEFWKVLRDGKYFHPGKKPVQRAYGYVGNVCQQILQLIELKDRPEVSRQIFYLGDELINLLDWVNRFSLSITNHPVRIVPKGLVFSAALIGSMLRQIKIRFPITLSRYRNMTLPNGAPMKKTLQLLGSPKYSMQEGVNITTEWLFQFWGRNK